MKREKDRAKIFARIRRAEEQIAFAPPEKAAKLATLIVRLKSTVFDQ